MYPMQPLPISVVIVTKNEEKHIEACLHTVCDSISDIIVVDSHSDDETCEIIKSVKPSARIFEFTWDGRYPKKRQWALDTLDIKYDWVLFLDADERLTPAFFDALRRAFHQDVSNQAGVFLKSAYMFQGKPLRYGLQNNKLALLNRHKMCFPVVDDLGIDGMGEIEGHYQPVLRDGVSGCDIGKIDAVMFHDALDDTQNWRKRHENYAQWESGMNKRDAWPADPIRLRRLAKIVFRSLSLLRPYVAFVHAYVFKLGMLDGEGGLYLAQRRFEYYRMIARSNV